MPQGKNHTVICFLHSARYAWVISWIRSWIQVCCWFNVPSWIKCCRPINSKNKEKKVFWRRTCTVGLCLKPHWGKPACLQASGPRLGLRRNFQPSVWLTHRITHQWNQFQTSPGFCKYFSYFAVWLWLLSRVCMLPVISELHCLLKLPPFCPGWLDVELQIVVFSAFVYAGWRVESHWSTRACGLAGWGSLEGMCPVWTARALWHVYVATYVMNLQVRKSDLWSHVCIYAALPA